MIRLCTITTTPITIKAFFGEQLNFMRANEYDVTIITSPIMAKSESFGCRFQDGITYKSVQMDRVIRPYEDIKAFFKILLLLKRSKFDIIQYATPKAALIGSVASWLVRIPVRLYLMWGLYYVTQSGIKKKIFKFFEKIVCLLSTDITPDSKGNCRFAVEEGLCSKGKIEVILHGSANGVDTERFNPRRCAKAGIEVRNALQIPLAARVFGSITPIVGDKGVNELISAFIQIAEKYNDVYLLIVGDTEEKDPVNNQTLIIIKSHSKIRNVGFQKEPERYLAAMNYFILPTYREGFGVVNIEASAMQLPVISTDVPGPQESIIDGKTGLLVPARKVKPLLKAMKRFLDDPRLARQLGIKGRQRVQQCFEQKQLWNAILEHRKALLIKSKRFKAEYI